MGDSKVISRAEGKVLSITGQAQGLTRLIVEVAGKDYPAINFDGMTGEVRPGDLVLLNTTAVDLKLGTGGSHFVMANLSLPTVKQVPDSSPGHIMKIRYTPNQIKVMATEEQDSFFHEVMANCTSLNNTPVVCCSLHSMLPPAAAAIKAYNNNLKVVYVMTDAAALPLGLSKMVQALKREQLLDGTVTVGHAFGGDLETVNIYSGLLAAKEVLKGDIIIAGMGPGIVGTGTPFGFSGIEQAGIIHAAHSLEGIPVAIPRISFADKRERHRGLSHHSRTVFGRATLVSVNISMPLIDEDRFRAVIGQMQEAGITSRHRIVMDQGEQGLDLLEQLGIRVTTMGRSVAEEPEFFLAASCAGRITAKIHAGETLNYWEEKAL